MGENRQKATKSLYQRVSDGYFGRAVWTFSPQKDVGNYWDVVIPLYGCFTAWTVGGWINNGHTPRDSVYEHIVKGTKHRTNQKEESVNHSIILCIPLCLC
jgi:hypothetical protein